MQDRESKAAPTAEKKIALSVRVDPAMAEEYKIAAESVFGEHRRMNEVGVRLLRMFIDASDGERRKMLGLPKPSKAKAVKA